MKRVSIIAVLLLAVVAASAYFYWRLQPEPLPAQVVYASGRIEADEVRIAPEVPGRVVENAYREGQSIRAGDLIARVDPTDFELQADQASAQQTASQRSALQIDAQIDMALHHAGTARDDLGRYETLRKEGWVTIPQVDLRRNAFVAASDQVSVLRQQRAQADAQAIVAARSLSLARERLKRTNVYSPLTGSVLERLAEPGEVVAAGQPLAVVANLSRIRLKVFVSEADLGRLRLGAPARIRVDAFPSRSFDARIAQVDAQAQFTPRDVHMKDERARTVYGVTLEAANPQGLLKPGMPADAWILWDALRGWPARFVVPE